MTGGKKEAGTEEGTGGKWEELGLGALGVSSRLPCSLPGDLPGSGRPHSVQNWPPPHIQGQHSPGQAFQATVRTLQQWAAHRRTRGMFQLLASDLSPVGGGGLRPPSAPPLRVESPPGAECACCPHGRGTCICPLYPPARSRTPFSSCSPSGISPVLTRALRVSSAIGPEQSRDAVLAPPLTGPLASPPSFKSLGGFHRKMGTGPSLPVRPHRAVRMDVKA